MTRNEVIAMAREAGMNLTPAQFSGVLEDEVDEFKLERFAALVAAAEREACAKVAMTTHTKLTAGGYRATAPPPSDPEAPHNHHSGPLRAVFFWSTARRLRNR